jgi:hypothetical protein
VNPDRPTHLVVDAQHDHVGKSDQQLAHARRVQFHRVSPDLEGFDTIKFAEPQLRVRDAQTPLVSEVPDFGATTSARS